MKALSVHPYYADKYYMEKRQKSVEHGKLNIGDISICSTAKKVEGLFLGISCVLLALMKMFGD